MARRLISSGSAFEKEFGYSRAVVDGPFCFVSGTTGYDYATMTMPEGADAQLRNALKTVEGALSEAGFKLSDVVRVVLYLTDAAHFPTIQPVMGEAFGDIRPANSTVIVGLVKPEMKVEIEVTAYKPA